MSRYVAVFACLSVVGCATEELPSGDAVEQAASLAFSREHVTADIYHYSLDLPVGDTPNATIRIHRVVREVAPFVPRRTNHAVMAVHGDFSKFETTFAPSLGDPASPVLGLAPYLASQNVDAWGVDRRWTLPGADDDISDFATMGLAQEVSDTRAALAIARAVRLAGGSGGARMALVGFSHGAQLAYAVAGLEGGLPVHQRHVSAIVPLDWWGGYSTEQEADRLVACEFSAFEYQLVADGVTDSPNDLFIILGNLARTDPEGLTPFGFPPLAGHTNRDAMLIALGQTWQLVPFTPWYHLLAPELDGDVAVGFSETSEDAATAWIAGATPHQSMLEAADFDAMLCNETLPLPAPMSNITVPIFYIGAAGGVGALGIPGLSLTSSTEIETLVVQRFAEDRATADFGHGDLLFADDAATLVWQPLVAWLAQH